MNRKIIYAIIAVLAVSSCYFFYLYMRMKDLYTDALLTLEVSASTYGEGATQVAEPEEIVMFYICGEVISPDTYTLPKGSRIIDAIEAAGGQTGYANLEMMESVAGEIVDGQKIYVPNIDDNIDKIKYMNNNSSGSYESYVRKDENVIVNINEAGIDELCQIPGIGEATAKLIYDYRIENGDFTIIEDIKNVTRIGDKTFENIKKNITVDNVEK